MELEPVIYMDGIDITDKVVTGMNEQNGSIEWYRQIGNGELELIQKGKVLTRNFNELGQYASGVISYICSAWYRDNTKVSKNQITFTRVNTGEDGFSAHNVMVKYSADGDESKSSDIYQEAIHKYIHLS